MRRFGALFSARFGALLAAGFGATFAALFGATFRALVEAPFGTRAAGLALAGTGGLLADGIARPGPRAPVRGADPCFFRLSVVTSAT